MQVAWKQDTKIATHPCINWAMHVEEVVFLLICRVVNLRVRPHRPKLLQSCHAAQPVQIGARAWSLFSCAHEGDSLSALCSIIQIASFGPFNSIEQKGALGQSRFCLSEQVEIIPCAYGD